MRRVSYAGWRLLCQVTFWSGIGPLLSWCRRRWAPHSWTLVTYHRVGDPRPDGGPDIVSPGRFRRQIRYFRRRYDVVPVGEALDRLSTGVALRRPLLSITFDDGYHDNLTNALPILAAEGCRATLYVTVEALTEGVPPWTHRLAADLLFLCTESRRPAAMKSGPVQEVLDSILQRGGRQRGAILRKVLQAVERVKTLPDPERERFCKEASKLTNDAGRQAARMLSPEHLGQWQEAGMEVGSHTWSHRILSRVSDSVRRLEIAGSREALEKCLGKSVRHFAYPNGGSVDWNEAVIQEVEAAGFRSAVTTIEGINGRDCDPFRLRRIAIGNDSLPVFAARVSGLYSRLRATVRAEMAQTPSAIERPLRVAFIGARGVGSAYSGIERYYEEVGSRLAARGHRVLVYCRAYFSPKVRFLRGLELIRIPTIRSKHVETLLHTALATIDVCFRRVDIVQFHALGSSPFAWVPRLFGKRTVVSVRGLDWQRAKWGRLARFYLRFCESTSIHCPNATVVVSKVLRRHFTDRFGLQVRYIPNGVGRPDGAPPDVIRKWGLGSRNYLLYAGRLSPEKRLEDLIEAHRSLPSECRLVIAGGSSYSEEYMERLRNLADSRAVFTGFQTGKVLQELYGNALAFVLPSQMEGLSVALLEAMAYGLPVVASDIPENRELVEECGGFLFRLGDSASLAEVLRRVIEDPQTSLSVGQTSRRKVRDRYDWDRIALETEVFYQALMGGSTSGTAQAAAEPQAEPAHEARDGKMPQESVP